MDRKKIEEDESRVIANMNVEGMPWYTPKRDLTKGSKVLEPLTKKQSRYLISGALKGALLVVLVLSLSVILFVLFSTKIWLK